MSESAHRRGVKQAIESIVEKDLVFGGYLINLARELREERFKPKRIVDAIFQNHASRYPDIVDAFCFSAIWSDMRTGRLAVALQRVGRSPAYDRERALNQAAVANLEGPVKCWVDQEQNNADSDGSFSWSEPILMRQSADPSGDTDRMRWARVEPATLPLEIGYTQASCTLLHLKLNGGVARWPYECDDIVLFKMMR